MHDNLGALDVLPRLADRELRGRINEAVGWIGLDT